MTTTEDRPTSVLDRPRPVGSGAARRPVTVPQQAGAAPVTPPQAAPVPRGWGSHAERRLMRQVLLFFALLGLYAVGFVLLGALVWS